MAVGKPSGMSVHNEPGKDLRSIMKSCLASNKAFAQKLMMDPLFGLHAVHRLDRSTSGVMLLACRLEIFSYLADQFRAGTVSKRYIAILHGNLKSSNPKRWATWNRPLTEKRGGRNCPEGRGKKKESRTRYRVTKYSKHYTVIVCEPLTGRTHQIRRHAKLAGHAVVGDIRYGTKRSIKYLTTRLDFNRLALHAASLSLHLPGNEKETTLLTTETPLAIKKLITDDLSS